MAPSYLSRMRSHSLYINVQLSSLVRCLNFVLNVYLRPVLMFLSIKDSGETAQTHSLVLAFVSCMR